MNQEHLEHLIRASGQITDQYEFLIIGSQSILGGLPCPPRELTMSAEADLYPLQAPELADLIDAAIGEGSHFHDTFGYYAQGVGPETACLPEGWQRRLHRIQNAATDGRVGYCLDVLDLFLAKAAANRDKDRRFNQALLRHRLVKPEDALALVPLMPLEADEQGRLAMRIRRWARDLV